MTDEELAAILGVTTDAIGEMRADRRSLEPQSEPYGSAILFIMIWRAVNGSLYRSDDAQTQAWLRRAHVRLCGASPIDVMTTPRGLFVVRSFTTMFEEPAEYAPPLAETEIGARIQNRAIDVLGTPAAAAVWLFNSQPSLGGRSPEGTIGLPDGERDVLRVLDLIDHGDYI